MLLFAEPGAGATTAEPKTTTMKVHAVRGRGIDFTRRSSGGQSRPVGAYPSLWGAGTCAVTPRHIRDGECVSSVISAPHSRRRMCIVGDQRAMQVSSIRAGADWSSNAATYAHFRLRF